MKTHTFRNSTGACRLLPGGGVAAVIYAGVRPDRAIIVASDTMKTVVLKIGYQYERINVGELEAFRDWSPEAVKEIQQLVNRVELKMEIVKRRKHSPTIVKRRRRAMFSMNSFPVSK